jgi:iron(III) transport system substrate-binding protein
MRIVFLTFISLFFISSSHSSELNLFTSRHYPSDLILFKKFEEKTGVKVNVINAKSKVLEKRLLDEGPRSKGDVLFLADAGALYSAEKKKLFAKYDKSKSLKLVPMSLKNEYWLGITKRARIVFYNPNLVEYNEIRNISYEDLSNEKWRESIAIRQSNNIYNQSLVASMLEHRGEDFTKKWLEELVKNFSRKPQGNDRAQILSVAAGESKLAIANTYYYALMLSGKKGEDQKKAAQKVKPIFPNQNDRGTHINISGAGILRFSPNKKNAQKFIEFLLTEDAQTKLCNSSFEFPIIENVPTNKLINNIKNFKEDINIDVSTYGKRQAQAFKLMKKAGWN